MSSYYDRLSAERLRCCYELAPPEVQAYLDGEGEYILASLKPGGRVLELGCGYGRVLAEVVRRSSWVVGIDLSLSSLALAHRTLLTHPGVIDRRMTAVSTEWASLSMTPPRYDEIEM